MHAIVVERFGDPSVLAWRERPDPSAGPGQVVVRVTCTGVNFADVMQRRGGYRGAEPPFVPGIDAAGVVEAAGAGVDAALVGRRVAAYATGGAYAERVVADARLVYVLPDGVPDEAAAALNQLVTAYNVVAAAALGEGTTVLIHAAAGGVGSLAVQLARALGARVVATAGGTEKCAFVRALGAETVVDSRATDFAAALRDHAVDAVLDSVAGDVFAPSLAALAPFGRYVVFGQAGGAPGALGTDQLHRENRRIIGYSSGGFRQHRPDGLRSAAEAALRHVAGGTLRVTVGATFPLSHAADAQRLLESRASYGKVLLSTI